jgi:hypothetical protein
MKKIKLILFVFSIALLTSCGAGGFGDGKYAELGHGSETKEFMENSGMHTIFNDYEMGLEFIFDKGKFQVFKDDKLITKGQWHIDESEKTLIHLVFKYEDEQYSEGYEVFNPGNGSEAYKLELQSELRNSFYFNLMPI